MIFTWINSIMIDAIVKLTQTSRLEHCLDVQILNRIKPSFDLDKKRKM